MNCEKCQELISAFVDGDLPAEEKESVGSHLSMCPACAKLHEDFAAIISSFGEPFSEDTLPPNSQALWCRINNMIESELEESRATGEAERDRESESAIYSRTWRFSPGQVFASILLVAMVSSLITIVAFKNFSAPGDGLEGYAAEPSVFDKMLADIGIAESPGDKAQRRLNERKSAIEYWTKRVAKRRIEWDADTRVTFDRNMDVIEQAVKQYTLLLKENPQDEISTEMLDSALNEKMELLREFSEL